MNCKNCNAFVPDDSAFCPECGQKVEVVQTAPEAPAQVFCATCGAAVPAGSGFCENCGAPVEAAEPAKKAKKFALPKKALLLAGAAIAVVLVAVLVIALLAGGKGPSYLVYMADGDMMLAKTPTAKAQEVEEELNSWPILNKAGDKAFFLDEDGKLVYMNPKNLKKEPVTVAKGVSSFNINETGSNVYYMKDGKLYVADLKDNSEKISDNVGSFKVSHDGKTLVYLKDKDDEVELHKVTLSGVKIKKDVKVKAGDSVNLKFFSDDGKIVVFTVDETIFIQNNNKDAVKVADDSSILGKVYDDGSFYYVEIDMEEEEYTLNFFDGKKSKELTKDINNYEDYAVDAPVLVYTFREDDEISYFVAAETTITELKAEDVAEILVADDGKSLYVLHDYEEGEGTLSKAEISGKKLKSLKKLDTAVSSVLLRGGNKAAWFKDVEDGEGTLYFNGKKVADDVSTSGVAYNEEKGWLMFYKDEDTLYRFKGSKAVKIADDVEQYVFSPKGELVILHDCEDYEGTLSLYTGSKLKKIAEDVSGVTFLTSPFCED